MKVFYPAKRFIWKTAAFALLGILLSAIPMKAYAAERTKDAGWSYEDDVLRISSNGGYAAFFTENPNTPRSFDAIIFEEGVTQVELDQDAFLTVDMLSIPSTVQSLSVQNDWWVSIACSSLIVSPKNPWYYVDNGMLIRHDSQTVLIAESDLVEAVVPERVLVIGRGAFSGNENLKRIELPEGLRIIGPDAFYNCTALEQLRLPNSLLAVFDGAFSYCESLKTLVVPPNMTAYVLEASASEGLAGAALVEENSSLTTIVLSNPEQFSWEFRTMYDWAQHGGGRLIFTGLPPKAELFRLFPEMVSICYSSDHAAAWEAFVKALTAQGKTVRALTEGEERELETLCDGYADGKAAQSAVAFLGWDYTYRFGEYPDNHLFAGREIIHGTYRVYSEEGLRNYLEDPWGIGYRTDSQDIALMEGITSAICLGEPRYQEMLSGRSLSISSTVSVIPHNLPSFERVGVDEKNPYYHMEDNRLIETSSGAVLWDPGWNYEEGILSIRTNDGVARFFQDETAPLFFDAIIFEEGVTRIDLLAESNERRLAVKTLHIPASARTVVIAPDSDENPSSSHHLLVDEIMVAEDNPSYHMEQGRLIEVDTGRILWTAQAADDKEDKTTQEKPSFVSPQSAQRPQESLAPTTPSAIRTSDGVTIALLAGIAAAILALCLFVGARRHRK